MGLFDIFKNKKTHPPEKTEQYFEGGSIYYYVEQFRQVEIVPNENLLWLTDLSRKVNDPDFEMIPLNQRKISIQQLENLIISLELNRISTVWECDGQAKQQQVDCIGFGKSNEAIFYIFKDNIVESIWFTGHWWMDKMKLANFLHELGQRWDLLFQDDNLRITIDLKNKIAIHDYLHKYDVKKLSDIDEKTELGRGTKIRIMLENENYGTNYFDYMLVKTPDDHDHMILVNITSGNYKEGAVFVNKVEKTISGVNAVNKKSLKKALGPDFENCYLLNR